MRLSRCAREIMDLARSQGLGRDFPSLDNMIDDSDGNPKKLARLISNNYGRNISENDVIKYARMYQIKIRKN